MRQRKRAFTLTELLVVIAIIGIMTAIAIPAMKGLGQSNTMTSAARQLLDDLALARHKAIVGQTTVHMIFVGDIFSAGVSSSDPAAQKILDNIAATPYSAYALYAERSVGDQPGQRFNRYLTGWRTLPDGIFIAKDEFRSMNTSDWLNEPLLDRPFHYQQKIPFPTINSPAIDVPHVAFDRNGSLLQRDNAGVRIFSDEYIWLTRGSVLAARDNADRLVSVDVRETPPPGSWRTNYNRIRIDATTGRAKLERPELQ